MQRITITLDVADDNLTVDQVKAQVIELGNIANFWIEEYSKNSELYALIDATANPTVTIASIIPVAPALEAWLDAAPGNVRPGMLLNGTNRDALRNCLINDQVQDSMNDPNDAIADFVENGFIGYENYLDFNLICEALGFMDIAHEADANTQLEALKKYISE